jgi:hypothetical protein
LNVNSVSDSSAYATRTRRSKYPCGFMSPSRRVAEGITCVRPAGKYTNANCSLKPPVPDRPRTCTAPSAPAHPFGPFPESPDATATFSDGAPSAATGAGPIPPYLVRGSDLGSVWESGVAGMAHYPLHSDGLGGVVTGSLGVSTSDGDMRMDRSFVRWMMARTSWTVSRSNAPAITGGSSGQA